MAKVTELTYDRLFPLAKFENVRIGITVSVDPDDDLDDVYAALRARVNGFGEAEQLAAKERAGGNPATGPY